MAGQTEYNLRQIDDHAIRIGQSKGIDRYPARQIDDEAGLFGVAAEPDRIGDRVAWLRPRCGNSRTATPAETGEQRSARS